MSIESSQVEEAKTDETDEEGGRGKGGVESGKGKPRRQKKYKRLVQDIIVHIYATFNNTVVTVTDVKGNVLSWATAGGSGFRGSRKSTPFAAQVAVDRALRKAKELYGAESAEIRVCGPGPGRDAATR
ncbi:MAG TPA: 30S ribosomal protein S11, partial [Gammaproteobacteria bacterium]|nr:30S ribosomal protein S11 [Gammaproteobacteria bacterium]